MLALGAEEQRWQVSDRNLDRNERVALLAAVAVGIVLRVSDKELQAFLEAPA